MILYLDDSQTALGEVLAALAASGYEVLTARTVLEAQQQIGKCDLAIIDFHMPEMTGDAALTVLRRSVGPGKAPLFYLYTTDAKIASGFRTLGFDGAFTWKGNTEALVTQLNTASRILKMRRFVATRRA